MFHKFVSLGFYVYMVENMNKFHAQITTCKKIRFLNTFFNIKKMKAKKIGTL